MANQLAQTSPDLDEVYRKFGETSEAAQLLETELGNLLLAVTGKEENLFEHSDKERSTSILNRINLRTLGGLLKALEKKMGGAKVTISIFEEAVEARNRLSHSFYRQHNTRLNTTDGCLIMLEDLEGIHEVILKAYMVASALSDNEIELQGIHIPEGHLPI